MVQRLVRLTLLAVLLLSGCAVTPPAENAEPVTADTELQGSPAMALLSRAEQARAQGQTGAASRYLERALTMAPNSSWLYRELALLRLEEGGGHQLPQLGAVVVVVRRQAQGALGEAFGGVAVALFQPQQRQLAVQP